MHFFANNKNDPATNIMFEFDFQIIQKWPLLKLNDCPNYYPVS